MWGFGYIQDSVMPMCYSWNVKRTILTEWKIKMKINSNEGETKTRWASLVAGDIMYIREDGKSGHKYKKKSWSGHRIIELI